MLKTLISEYKKNETWLLERILEYASAHDYTRYASTLMEAWRASIEGLTDSLERYMLKGDLSPIDATLSNFNNDEAAAFAKMEAIRHRNRGLGIVLFMGLFKYYKRTYIDFIHEYLGSEYLQFSETVGTFFDRVEILFVEEWIAKGDDEYKEALIKENTHLTTEKNRFLIIFESLYEPVFVFDDKGEIVNANLQALMLNNINSIPGMHYYSGERIELPPRFIPLVREAMESENDLFTNTLEYEEDGVYYNFELLFNRLLDISKKFKGFSMIVNDRSELKRAERELREKQKELISINKNLNRKIKQETQKRLKNERLLIDQKKSADLGNMINAIAHQWRQPLNNLGLHIQYIFQALQNEVPAEELYQYEGKMQELLEYMSKTIDDFRGLMVPDKEEVFFSVPKAVTESLALVDMQLRNHNISFTLETNDSQYAAYGSISELKQVILNLIINAKEAFDSCRRAGKKNISISINEDEDNIIVRIADNAGGMSAVVTEKMFYPYFTTKSKGTGIGLYMSKIIIEDSFEGELTLKNENDGAAAYIFLPKQDIKKVAQKDKS